MQTFIKYSIPKVYNLKNWSKMPAKTVENKALICEQKILKLTIVGGGPLLACPKFFFSS